MARLIDSESPQNRIYVSDLVIEEMKKIPTVDIDRPTRSQFKRMAAQLGYEKVVHCKDCKRYSESEPHYRIYGDGNCRTWNSYVSEKGFCHYGERKTDEKV